MDTFESAGQRLESFPRQKGAHDLAKNLGVHRTNDNMMNALSQHKQIMNRVFNRDSEV